MAYQPSRPVIVAGIKHSGKSTIGKKLATRLSLPFYDLDDCVVGVCREDRGGVHAVKWEPREIYRRLGKTAFQQLELTALKIRARDPGPYVLALGGGTPENPESMDVLLKMGILVYLHEDAGRLFTRIEARGLPPFLSGDSPWETFLQLYNARDSLYSAAASVRIYLDGRGTKEATDLVVQGLKEYDHVGK